ncbi:hypothetical protein BGZ46_001090 [Entomortierella lignicola]|nr:hypothetical protein BGZ46_001090 [Entomortierella lignicola]
MDLLLGNHLQESARRAAGSFLSPLTNAIGEQRRLVESLAIVSKVRVEECKHMMVWSKSQTDDLGDVLLKLNLLIRKISDYEIRFGTQYESFREKIKYLRTKDDSLCEMGRLQADLQNKLVDASKSRLRTAKALLLQKELDDIQKNSAPTTTKLQKLKREIVKGAYTEQLNAIIELGKKMQIIGEHGKQLLEHIDLPASIHDGRQTEDILQSARISLENWDKLVMVDPESIVVHPPPTPPRSNTGLSSYSVNSVQSLAVSESQAESDSGSETDSDVEFVAAPTSPLKAKPSVASTIASTKSSKKQPEVTAAAVAKEKKPEAETLPAEAMAPEEDQAMAPEEDQAETPEEEEDVKTPKSDLLSPFGSTLVPKLTLTPSKPKAVPVESLPVRSSDWASEATAALASVNPPKKLEDIIKEHDTSASEAETLRRLEELEVKRALEMSLIEAQKAAEPKSGDDLQLTAEELRFVMGDVAPKRSTKVVRRQARAPETVDGSTPATITRPAGSRRSKRATAAVKVDTEVSHTDTESEKDLETPKASKPRVRGPQAAGPETNRISQQGPRPWVPESEEGEEEEEEEEEEEDEEEDTKSVTSGTSTVDLQGPEELASASEIGETMGETGTTPSTAASKKSGASKAKQSATKVYESMGSEPEKPLESMGSEPEKTLESMGSEPEQLYESMGDDGLNDNNSSTSNVPDVPYVPMPQMPVLDQIRQQKIMQKQQQQHQQQQMAALGVSPELQYLSLQNSPQSVNQQLTGQGYPSPQSSHGSVASTPTQAHALANYQSVSYKPSTAYVPNPPKQKNRLSGSHGSNPGSSPAQQYQQQYQHQQSGTYSAQYLQQQQQQLYQQQQQLQDFYYSPYEQEYQQQQYQQYLQQVRDRQRQMSTSSVGSTNSAVGIAPLGWTLPGMETPQVTDDDVRQYHEMHKAQHQSQQQYQQQQQQYQQQQQQHQRTNSASGSVYSDRTQYSNAPSPASSHISLVPDHSASPVIGSSPVMGPTHVTASVAPLNPHNNQSSSASAGAKKVPLTPNPDDYKVEVK